MALSDEARYSDEDLEPLRAALLSLSAGGFRPGVRPAGSEAAHPGKSNGSAVATADGTLADLPIITVTAKAMKGDWGKSIAAGASEYVTKPVDIAHLVDLMRDWLDREPDPKERG